VTSPITFDAGAFIAIERRSGRMQARKWLAIEAAEFPLVPCRQVSGWISAA
jgi:hypothetical protein